MQFNDKAILPEWPSVVQNFVDDYLVSFCQDFYLIFRGKNEYITTNIFFKDIYKVSGMDIYLAKHLSDKNISLVGFQDLATKLLNFTTEI